jgi:hypothetical protein
VPELNSRLRGRSTSTAVTEPIVEALTTTTTTIQTNQEENWPLFGLDMDFSQIEVLSKIGTGTYGEVFKARVMVSDEPVTLFCASYAVV